MRKLGDALGSKLEAALKNLPPLPPTPVAVCEFCQDLGMIKAEGSQPGDPAFGRLFPCPNPECPKGNAIRQDAIQRRYKGVGLLEDYRGLTFATFDSLPVEETTGKLLARYAMGLFVDYHAGGRWFSEVDIYDAMQVPAPPDASRHLKNSIVLCGAPGTGKTGLVAATINRELELKRPALYIRMLDIIKDIQDSYGREEHPTTKDIVTGFQNASLLAIDEMTIHNSKQADRLEKAEDIIRHRMGRQLPTLITTNHTQAEFVEAWGVRTADILDAKAHWIQVTGLPLRKYNRTITGV